ncbi:MAG: hypothetical protein K0Q65_3384 [Clostridia bacterium]|jgi:hypothetical protein|nr:hypothetical protein [Clostridia bacterium]
MRIEITGFGHLVFLVPEEQQDTNVIEKIARLKEIGKVVVVISGSENPLEIFYKLIK